MVITLITPMEGWVGEASILPLTPPPDVVVWQERVFQHRGNLIYIECSVYTVRGDLKVSENQTVP